MSKGDTNLSRARGAKAQSRRNNQNVVDTQHANTIDFHQATRHRKKPPEIIPKSIAQEELLLSMLDTDCAITVAVGPAGTGKSYVAMVSALRDLRAGRVQKIVLTRPAVGVEDERHGFLPGDLVRKMEPWTRPLLDIIKEFYSVREVATMIEDEIIEISPLAFMRGRTFKNAWIVADEMQNATPNQVKMLLTRIGEGSRIVITGDVEQTDRASTDNGLLDLAGRLQRRSCDGIRVCTLGARDIQRHPIISQVLEIYS